MKIDKDFFDENGYCIVRNVFSIDEINEFRKLAYETLEQDKLNKRVKNVVTAIKDAYFPMGDLMGKPLVKVLFSDRILQIANSILGQQPTYFGDSTYQIGVGDRGFHRDNVDRIANVGDDWKSEYDIIRLGVYMQDHDVYSGGLKVIKESHRGKGTEKVFIDSKAGDVVVWNLRTLHSGNAVRLKLWPSLVMGYRLENKLPKFLFKDSQQERISCFMSFGKEGTHLDRYIDKYMKVKIIDQIKEFNKIIVSDEIDKKDIKILKIND